jgi:hypothetical protein
MDMVIEAKDADSASNQKEACCATNAHASSLFLLTTPKLRHRRKEIRGLLGNLALNRCLAR